MDRNANVPNLKKAMNYAGVWQTPAEDAVQPECVAWIRRLWAVRHLMPGR
jgi:hypothetical protein